MGRPHPRHKYLLTVSLFFLIFFSHCHLLTMEKYDDYQKAVAHNQKTEFEKLLKTDNILLDRVSKKGNTFLHIAAWHNSSDVAEFLLENDISDEELNKKGLSPLHIATQKRHIKLAYLLLRHGVNPSLKTADEKTSLHIAALDGNNEMIKLLLHFGARCDSQDKKQKMPLHLAIRAKKKPCIQTLVQWGTNLHAKRRNGSITILDKLSTSFLKKLQWLNDQLQSAINEGDYDQMGEMLNQGAQVNCQNSKGETPLHRAVLGGYRAMIYVLLLHGANPTIQNSSGETPIHYALSHLIFEDPTERGRSIFPFLFKISRAAAFQFLPAIKQAREKTIKPYLGWARLPKEEDTSNLL